MWNFVCILLFGWGFLPGGPKESIVILKQAFTIEGATSVGTFTCTYELEQRDTLHTSQLEGDTSVRYNIPSDAFGCRNFLLNRDFKKTIKAKEYKEIKVEISKLRRKDNHYLCDLKLKLAGKEKVYENTSLKASDEGLTGFLVVQFSEFELTPPKKMGGLVKVKEDIKISIELTVL